MASTAQHISDEAVFSVGKVIAVSGRTVEVKVDKTKNTSHLVYKGELLRNISVGSYIKIVKGFTRLIGKVEGEKIQEDKGYAARRDYASDREKVDRTLTVSLLGFFKGSQFERGIKELPLIDNECFLLQRSEFEQVHNFTKHGDSPLTIGTLSFEKGQPIRVGVDSLFASHIGIFGNTGSGKSYTLAKIYRELLLKYKDRQTFRERARFFLLDFNGEYVEDATEVFDDIIIGHEYKQVYRLSTHDAEGDRFPVTPETINDADFWGVFLEATEKTQTPFLKRAIGNNYVAAQIGNAEGLKQLIAARIWEAMNSGDRTLEKSIVTNFLKELDEALQGNESLETLIADYEAHLKFHNLSNVYYFEQGVQKSYVSDQGFFETVVLEKVAQLTVDPAELGPMDRIRLMIVLQYYSDVVRGFANRDHLSPLIKRLDKRFESIKRVIKAQEPAHADDRVLTIVSLKDVNMQMRKILPLLFCKQLYSAKKAENDPDKYLNIIVDEAHNVLSHQSERESEQWKDYRLETFEEIIKEGRKFGVFLTVATVRHLRDHHFTDAQLLPAPPDKQRGYSCGATNDFLP